MIDAEQLRFYSGVRVRIPEDLRLVTRVIPDEHRRLSDLIEIDGWYGSRELGTPLYKVRLRRLDILEAPERSATFAAWRLREAFELPRLDYRVGRFGW